MRLSIQLVLWKAKCLNYGKAALSLRIKYFSKAILYVKWSSEGLRFKM